MEPRGLTFQLLEEITDGFSEERKLGQGAYGKVYRGVGKHGLDIAVKLLHNISPELDDTQFQNEFRNLMMLKHENIVGFVGYCYETQQKPIQYNGRIVFAEMRYRALCFEYLHNGSLRKHLSGEFEGLDWHTRYKIIKGTCEGLKYLHAGLREPIYHLDLKPDNILLDGNMVPKLADFGLSRIFGEDQTQITQSPIGTRGYVPPEYIERNVISRNKFDIFSLGAVMIKTVTGPTGYSRCADVSSLIFLDTVQGNWRKRLQTTWSGSMLEAFCQQVKTCTEIALKCVEVDRHKRPDITDIIYELDTMENMIDKLKKIPEIPMQKIISCSESMLLSIEPLQLQFPLEPKKSMIPCPLYLTNNTYDSVAFRLLTNIPEDLVGPLCGVVPPRTRYTLAMVTGNQLNSDVFFTLESSMVVNQDLQRALPSEAVACYNRFFSKAKEDGRDVHRVNLTAAYIHTEPGNMIILRDNHATVFSVDMHPTEPWIMASRDDGCLLIWDYHKQERVNLLQSRSDQEACLLTQELTLCAFLVHSRANKLITPSAARWMAKFIAPKRWIMAGDSHGYIKVYTCDTMQEVKDFKAHSSHVTSFDIHPTEPYVLSSCWDKLIKLWDWEKGWGCIRIFEGQRRIAIRVKFDQKDASNFVSASLDAAQFWKIGSSYCEFTLQKNLERLTCFDYFTRGDLLYLITGAMFGCAEIWDHQTGTLVETLEGHTCVNAACSHPDLPILITGSHDGTVSQWSSVTFRLEGMLNFGLGSIEAIACLKGSKRIVIGHEKGLAVAEIYQKKAWC